MLEQGQPLAQFATFCALSEQHRSGWRQWPREYQHPICRPWRNSRRSVRNGSVFSNGCCGFFAATPKKKLEKSSLVRTIAGPSGTQGAATRARSKAGCQTVAHRFLISMSRFSGKHRNFARIPVSSRRLKQLSRDCRNVNSCHHGDLETRSKMRLTALIAVLYIVCNNRFLPLSHETK
jgi:hypothetical protein